MRRSALPCYTEFELFAASVTCLFGPSVFLFLSSSSISKPNPELAFETRC
jgi:hypothetical protein